MTETPAQPWTTLYTPKLLTVLGEGYGLRELRADMLAGLTVAIVALPLSMAIAISSGASPAAGLYTAIFGGVIVSLLGGSRFQIGGPAGAFILLVSATVARHGIDGLALATAMAGLMLIAIGALRLGGFIKYIPYPVTVGFTAGIAIVIFSGEIRDLLGLTLAGPEPGPLVPKLAALGSALPTLNVSAVAVAALTAGVILGLRRYRPRWPGMLIAVVLAALVARLLNLPLETIASRFGGVPSGLPTPHLPDLSPARIVALFPDALAFTLLGGVESLLSAVVADSMSGRRHRSNAELVAQGVANCASAVMGGICVTGTIARTATNVRAGARGPLAGVFHSLYLLLFILFAAPLAGYVPLAALAAVLGVVAWNMAERAAFATLLRASRGDAVVLLSAFLFTIFRGLTEGIIVGFCLACLVFLHRMAREVEVVPLPEVENDPTEGEETDAYDRAAATDRDVVVFKISGAFFFGAAGTVAAVLDRLGEHPRAYVVDFSEVSGFDSTAAATIEGFVRKAHRQGATVAIAGANAVVRKTLELHGVQEPEARYFPSVAQARAAARA